MTRWMWRFLFLSGVAFVACAPPRPGADFYYYGRRGDTLAALNARLGGDGRLAAVLAEQRPGGAGQPLGAGEVLRIPIGDLKAKNPAAMALSKVNESRVAREMGDYGRAVALAREAAAALPDDPGVLYELGAAAIEAGDYATAVTALAVAAAYVPEDEEVAVALATAYAGTGDTETAVASLEGFINRHPSFTMGYYHLGAMSARAGDYARARHYFFQYLLKEPTTGAAELARRGIKATARAEMMAACEEAAGAGETAGTAATAEVPREAREE